MTKQQQIQEQQKIINDLRIDRLNVNAKIHSLTQDVEQIDRDIKTAMINLDVLKHLESVKS